MQQLLSFLQLCYSADTYTWVSPRHWRGLSILWHTAQYLPWVQNAIADEESWTIVDWFENPNLYQRINHLFGPIEVDLFGSRLTAQCPVCFSRRPDPYAAAMDVFLQDWSQGILSQARSQNARLVLLAPVWKFQPWHPVLLGMLVDYPCLLPRDSQVMINPDPNTTTGCMAYTQDRYRNNQLLKEVMELTLNSWRTKTNKSHNSLFRKSLLMWWTRFRSCFRTYNQCV